MTCLVQYSISLSNFEDLNLTKLTTEESSELSNTLDQTATILVKNESTLSLSDNIGQATVTQTNFDISSSSSLATISEIFTTEEFNLTRFPFNESTSSSTDNSSQATVTQSDFGISGNSSFFSISEIVFTTTEQITNISTFHNNITSHNASSHTVGHSPDWTALQYAMGSLFIIVILSGIFAFGLDCHRILKRQSRTAQRQRQSRTARTGRHISRRRQRMRRSRRSVRPTAAVFPMKTLNDKNLLQNEITAENGRSLLCKHDSNLLDCTESNTANGKNKPDEKMNQNRKISSSKTTVTTQSTQSISSTTQSSQQISNTDLNSNSAQSKSDQFLLNKKGQTTCKL